MKPLNYAILKYFTKVDKASAKDVVEALKPEYGSFRALNEKAVLEALLTGVENGLLEEAGHTLDENNNVIKRQACSNQFYRFNDLFHENVILLTQQTTLVKKNFFFKVGGFDDSYKLIADTKFWIQASLMKPKFRYIKSFVSCYTLHESQLSSDKELQKKEHERLQHEFPSNNLFLRKFSLLCYRLLFLE